MGDWVEDMMESGAEQDFLSKEEVDALFRSIAPLSQEPEEPQTDKQRARCDIPWRNPDEDTPPKGQKLFLLTREGCAVIGMWGEGFVGWHPLFRVSESIRRKMKLNKGGN